MVGEESHLGGFEPCSPTPEGQIEWVRVGSVHYPSILHFGDMLADERYQEINDSYRKGSLIDNPLLYLREVDLMYLARKVND